MTFPGGEIVKVVAFQVMEGYDVAFFVAPLPPSLGREPSLPLQVVAYDAQGNTLANVTDGQRVYSAREGRRCRGRSSGSRRQESQEGVTRFFGKARRR